MLINDWDISEAGARQWTVEFASCDISSNSDWIEGSPIPTLFRNTTSFKTLTIKLMLKADGREELLRKRSDILAKMLDPCSITLDNYSNHFYGVLSDIDEPDELSMQRFHTLKFKFKCYEYGDEVTVNMDGVANIELINEGNILTPVIIEVTSETDLDSFEIRGVCRKLSVAGSPLEDTRSTLIETPILTESSANILATVDGEESSLLAAESDWGDDLTVVINGLKAGQTITISGETGLVTEADSDEIPDIELWDLPTILGGANLIQISDSSVSVTIRYCPRYM